MRKLLAAVVLWLTCSGQTAMAGVSATLDKLDPHDVCADAKGTGSILPERLARAVVKTYNTPIDFVDWNDTGISGKEYTYAVTKQYCLESGYSGHKEKCLKEDDLSPAGSAQAAMVRELQSAIADAAKAANNNNDFDLKLKQFVIRFHRLKSVMPLDEERIPILKSAIQHNDERVALAAEAFSQDPTFFSLECVKTEAPIPSPPTSDSGASGSAPAKAEIIPSSVRLRSKPEDLTMERNDEAFSGLNPASLAIANDRISKKETVDVHAVLGYALPSWTISGDIDIDSIPFLKYDRDYVDAKKAPKGSNIHNIGVGLVESVNFPTLGKNSFYSSLSIQPLYIHSFVDDSDLLKLQLRFQPEPLLPAFGYNWNPGQGDFSIKAYARAVADMSWVLDAGTNPVLATKSNFVQGGFQIGGSIFDSKEGSWLNGFSLPVEYTYLRGFSGPYEDVRLFSIALNYTFPKTKYISIGLSYSDGENLDTFAKQKIEKLTLGIKY